MPSDKLEPSLVAKFSALIWKIEIDDTKDIIAVETRDPATHSASFSGLNYTTGECYFKEQTTENSWWWGLDRVHKGLIYLHGYKNEGSPEHRGIIVWDAETGKTKWQHFNYAFDDIAAEGLIVHNPLIQSAKKELLSPESGELMQNNIQSYTPLNRDIIFPAKYSGSLPPGLIPENAVEPLLYLDYNSKKIWSFHVRSDTGFTQKLIITENEKIILSENLADRIQKLNPEAFFLQKNHLFCIRSNTNEIVSYLV